MNIFQPKTEEKNEHQHVKNIINNILKKDDKVDGILKCDQCPREMPFAQGNIDEIINFIKDPHKGCGGKIKLGILTFQIKVEILKNNTDSVETFCYRLLNSPNKKTEFEYEIRPTVNANFENTLILKTSTEKEGKELAGWICNSAALKGKLHEPAPEPFKIEKVYDFSIDFAKACGEEP